MATKMKTRVFDGKTYTITLVADNKRSAQIRASKIRDSGGLARMTTQKRSDGAFANRYFVWKR